MEWCVTGRSFNVRYTPIKHPLTHNVQGFNQRNTVSTECWGSHLTRETISYQNKTHLDMVWPECWAAKVNCQCIDQWIRVSWGKS